jgi:peptidoglycan/LPS O-acetylase OafA/YrhL
MNLLNQSLIDHCSLHQQGIDASDSHQKYKNTKTNPKYRADIDGLRAIAILLVVGYHAFPTWVTGGFIGVDIFFVISGFLISTIIFENLSHNKFSFFEFYSRRIRRIFPALILVLATSLIFGWFTLFHEEYQNLGNHLASGAIFLSNFKVIQDKSGYFDTASEIKPLLHLWSLGIEEQFYVLWPLLLWIIWKKKLNWLTIAIVITILSFIINIHSIKTNQLATFYLPQTRFWELMIGSILAHLTLYQNKIFLLIKQRLNVWLNLIIYRDQCMRANTLNNVESLLGIVLIATGISLIKKTSLFPGSLALLPTIGTALIISAGSQTWLNRKILSNRLLVWFGLISFPLYLWHWPLLSFVTIIETESPSKIVVSIVIFLSVLLAWITYKFIERPLRFGDNGKIKAIFLMVLMILVGCAGYACAKFDGLALRNYPLKYQSYTQSIVRSERESECFEIPYVHKLNEGWKCNLGNKKIKPTFFAYGDSHALSIIPPLEKLSFKHNVNIEFAGISNCPPILNVQSLTGNKILKYNCQKLNDRIFNFVKNSGIKNVIFVARWTAYTGGGITTKKSDLTTLEDGFSKEEDPLERSREVFKSGIIRTIESYNNLGVKVFIIEDNPHQIKEPYEALRISMPEDVSINRFSVTAKENNDNQLWVSELFHDLALRKNLKIISTNDIFCNDSICPLVKNKKFLYYDDDHLSVSGSMLIYPSIEQALGMGK